MSESKPVVLAVGASGSIGQHVVAPPSRHGYSARPGARRRASEAIPGGG